MKIDNVHSIETIMIKEDEHGEWIEGLLINSGNRIYYLDGSQPLDNVWDYQRTTGVQLCSFTDGVQNVEYDPKTKTLTTTISL